MPSLCWIVAFLLFQSPPIADTKNRRPSPLRVLVAITAFEHPTYDSSSVAEVEAGAILQGTGSETEHWYEVQLPSGSRGYVSKLWVVVQMSTRERPPKFEAGLVPKKLLEESSKSDSPLPFDLTDPVWADEQQLEIHQKPEPDSPALWQAPLGYALYSQQEEDDWIRVAFTQNPTDGLQHLKLEEGWVPKSTISAEQPTQDTVRKRRFIDSNPVPGQMRQLIMAGKIKLGMTPDMIRASWGEPPKSISGRDGGEEWRYSDGPTLIFRDGRLSAWKD